MTLESSSSVISDDASEITTAERGRKRVRDDGLIYLGPTDTEGRDNFENTILRSCDVYMYTKAISGSNVSVNSIFGKDFSFPPSAVYLHLKDEDYSALHEDLRIYLFRGWNEMALIEMLENYIFRRDVLVDWEDPEKTTTVKRIRWQALQPGPLIRHKSYTYDWDITPDLTYKLSVNLFSLSIREKLMKNDEWSWILADEEGIAPYLTVEFKCTAESGTRHDGERQIAAASVVWLFQRKQIRDKLGLDHADLKHYSILIIDASYFIFEAIYNGKKYFVKLRAKGDLMDRASLKRYAEWSNAIHAWGLGPHAASIKKDVELLLEPEMAVVVV